MRWHRAIRRERLLSATSTSQVPDPNLIASMSGHVEGSRAFARYRNIDDDMKRKLVDMIN